jgi:hypothetical protein
VRQADVRDHDVIFNTDFLCMDCAEKEQAHPAYQRARRIESAAVKRGDWIFAGVGKPADL